MEEKYIKLSHEEKKNYSVSQNKICKTIQQSIQIQINLQIFTTEKTQNIPTTLPPAAFSILNPSPDLWPQTTGLMQSSWDIGVIVSSIYCPIY